jgi:hypothetical protein
LHGNPSSFLTSRQSGFGNNALLGLLWDVSASWKMGTHAGDLDDEVDWPPYQTVKDVKRLTNDQLAEITAWNQFLLDIYEYNYRAEDPVTCGFVRDLRLLNSEIDKRLASGAMLFDELSGDQSEVSNSGSVTTAFKRNKCRPTPEKILSWGTLVFGSIGAVVGYLFHPVQGFPGALVGVLLGVCLPGAIVMFAAALWFAFYRAMEIFRDD